MSGSVSITFRDKSDETSTVQFRLTEPSAATYDAWVTAARALENATEDMSIGVLAKDEFSAFGDVVSGDLPANNYAQRETKWLVRYSDNTTGKRYSLEIPCANLSLLAASGDKADLTNATVIAFVAAFEASHLSPTGGNVTVVEIVHVGRNI